MPDNNSPYELILRQLSELRDDVKELKNLTARVVKIETEFQSHHVEISALSKQLSELRNELRDISGQIIELKAREAVIDELKSSLKTISAHQNKMRPYAEIANRVILFGGSAAIGAWLAKTFHLIGG